MPNSFAVTLSRPLKHILPNSFQVESFFTDLLGKAGITVNGSQPWDIQIHDRSVVRRVLEEGSIGLGDSYIDGLWDCRSLDQFSARVCAAGLAERVDSWPTYLQKMKSLVLNLQSLRRATQVVKKHYEIGNDLYRAMLDRRMNYSCGYWQNANSLDEAQEAKLDLICRKLQLEEGMRVVDIGCGWGGFLKFASERYGVSGVGLTLSPLQAEVAREACQGLPVDIRVQDYRFLRERFDRVVSIGMFEHVGYKNYPEYMKICHRSLKKNGLFLLHTIGGNSSVTHTDPWIEKHIFPNGMIPSVAQIGKSSENLFIMEDWHNFGVDYDRTLVAWYRNFVDHWPQLKNRYSGKFFRMWSFYLLMCAGSFRARYNQVWQIVLAKAPKDGYRRIL